MTPTGLQPTPETPGKTQVSQQGGAHSGARGGSNALSDWLHACPVDLPADVRRQIVGMIKERDAEE